MRIDLEDRLGRAAQCAPARPHPSIGAPADGSAASLPVISTGSAAGIEGARPEEVPNQYQAIRICTRTGFERWTRRYEPGRRRWIADTGPSDSGDDWHTTTPVAFEAAQRTFDDAQGHEPSRPPSDEQLLKRSMSFVERVAEIRRLRRRAAGETVHVEIQHSDVWLDYLRVSVSEAGVARVFPVGVSEAGVDAEVIDTFTEHIFAPYRQYDPGLRCELVYGGERASDDLISAAARQNVLLHSFTEFQGIIDFRGYVARQSIEIAGRRHLPARAVHPAADHGRDRRRAPAGARTTRWRRSSPASGTRTRGSSSCWATSVPGRRSCFTSSRDGCRRPSHTSSRS